MRDAPDMTMGEYRVTPVYPTAMSPVSQSMTGQVRWHPTRVAAGVLCFVALVLVVSSLFLPLYEGKLGFGGVQSIEVTITPWISEVTADDAPNDVAKVPKVGLPLVFSAVLVACAAALSWFSAAPGVSPGTGRVAGVTTVMSGAFLAGTVWTTALMVSNGVNALILFSTFGNGLESEAAYLVGYWLLITAVVLVVVAAVLSLIPVRPPVWQPPPPVNPDAPTPPYGVALPMGSPPPGAVDPLAVQSPLPYGPQEPAHGPMALVDPLTGLPLVPGAEAIVGPVSPPVGVPAPFTPEPRGPLDAEPASMVPPLPVAGPAPIVIPAPPPLPEFPPGPAIPATEDPLAEPPRT